MAEYSTSFDRSGGYSFDQQAITDLWKQAKMHTGKGAEISVSLEGSHTIRVAEIDELFDDAFIKNNYIEKVSISSHSFNHTPSQTISVTLRGSGFVDAVSVSISGDRPNCSSRLAEITNIVDGRKLWYSRYLFASSALSGISMGVIAGAIGMTGLTMFERYSGETRSLLFTAGALIAAYIALSLVVAVFRNRMFPKIIFEIGKSANVGIRAAYWRNVIGVGIILALVVGVIGGMAVERIK